MFVSACKPPVLISDIVFIEQGNISHRQIEVRSDHCPIHHSSCSRQRRRSAKGPRRHDSVSDETQELLRKFKLIFKDLINGVPTAYHDLEMLLTNGNRQLQDTYTKLPGFMQKLIEKLPEKWTESLAPEMLAVASERASRSGINMDNVGKAAAVAQKAGLNVPSLKELVSKPAAIVGMLRSIMQFLRARFPAVLGMNVLWSLALFSMWSKATTPHIDMPC